MKYLKYIFEPLHKVSKTTYLMIAIVEIAIVLGLWQIAGNGLIPAPLKIIEALITLLSSSVIYDNFMSSLFLTLQGMGISICIALLVSYLSVIPVFQPVARFIVKCRYLTLTGLIFVFTLLTNNGHQLKMGLLIFGIVPFFVTSLLSIIHSIDVQEYELCKTLRMNNWNTWLEVVVRGTIHHVFEVMRQNFAIAWMMITMVEGLSMSEGGLGTLLIKSSKYIDLSTIFAILIIIFFVGITFDYLFKKLRVWLFPYSDLNTVK